MLNRISTMTALGAVATALACAAGLVVHPSGAAGTAPAPDARGRLLPDLVQILPSHVSIAHRTSLVRGRRTLLTFAAAAENHGSGPLIIKGSRPDRNSSSMTARQLVRRADGGTEVVPNVGRLRFVRSRDHRHWHLADFMRYELRTSSGALVGGDHKTGYCLGDRFRIARAAFPGEPSRRVFKRRCGLSEPFLLSVSEGISVGYGDRYPAFLEGQFIDITTVPAGRYVLVQRVNPGHRLLDLHADNDVSSALVSIKRRGSRTRARIVKWCTSTETCRA
ncbi:MAG: hypothetical protein QOD53_2372 [Thermoleophilaceae bacterium]|nr:hypothetical protein [Thermoleophilaceae bacterium]